MRFGNPKVAIQSPTRHRDRVRLLRMHDEGITRRGALRRMGALAGAALTAPHFVGCGDAAAPGSITHIVVVMMENRSYDHYLGARRLLENRLGDGLLDGMANLDLDGVARAIYRETAGCVADPPHDWDAARLQLGAGANDGFLRAYQMRQGRDVAPHVMGYLGRDDLPVIYALADAYSTCDRWFASILGPTWPNRFYLHSAQSGGIRSNEPPTKLWPTIYDRLDGAGVPWGYYYVDLPVLVTLGQASQLHGLDAFYSDARAGILPPVSMVDPGFFLNDDHPPRHPLLGQQFIASIYNALATSPLWNHSLMVVVYDEHGGFFDHVVPPKAADERAEEGFDQLGFRVPALVCGPYAKRGQVSSVVHDHTSVLRHIETMFDLAPLTLRDAAANDLSDMLDLDRLARGEPAAPVSIPAVTIDDAALEASCAAPHKPTELELLADTGFIPRALDLRPYRRDMALLIGDQLAARGLGGIRRQ